MDFSDFTTENYRNLISLAKKRYSFCNFCNYENFSHPVIWRHDIDFSVHRSFQIAKIEQEYDVSTIFFISFHSEFYNPFEKSIATLIKEIQAMGHEIGLHFDPSYYDIPFCNLNSLEMYLAQEREMLSFILGGTEIKSFSFHNPDVGGNWAKIEMDTIGGMKNAYSPSLFKKLKYCSDSNGYWRYDRLENVLQAEYSGIYVLTHAVWYQDDPISPRNRIIRCVHGRCINNMLLYDSQLSQNGRKNIF